MWLAGDTAGELRGWKTWTASDGKLVSLRHWETLIYFITHNVLLYKKYLFLPQSQNCLHFLVFIFFTFYRYFVVIIIVFHLFSDWLRVSELLYKV